MDFVDLMDLISAFHMDLDWIWIYELVENGLWIGFGLRFQSIRSHWSRPFLGDPPIYLTTFHIYGPTKYFEEYLNQNLMY